VVAWIDRRGSILTTDEYAGYAGMNSTIAHRRINHSRSYVERDLSAAQFGPTHTNTIESFWAILKRAIIGQYHHVSRRYLPLYLNEMGIIYLTPSSIFRVLHVTERYVPHPKTLFAVLCTNSATAVHALDSPHSG
jgi:hypothetical protein